MEDNSYLFKNLRDLLDMVQKISSDQDILWDITGTPLESIWPSDIKYNGVDCFSLAFGEERMTPWGPLPGRILLVDKRFQKNFLKNPDTIPNFDEPKPKKEKINLFPEGWKPAPGFTDPRVDFN